MNERFINPINTISRRVEKLKTELKDELLKNGAILPDGTENTTYTKKKADLDALLKEENEHNKLVRPS
jgi:hypothetical protein